MDQICSGCCQTLTHFYDFFNLVLENHKKFLNINLVKLEPETVLVQIKKEEEGSVALDFEDNFQPEDEPGEYIESDEEETSPEVESSSKASRISKYTEVRRSLIQERENLIRKYCLFRCQECNNEQTFNSYSALQVHSRIVHRHQAKLMCCGRTFKARYDLAKHVEEKHADDELPKERKQIFTETVEMTKERNALRKENTRKREELIREYLILKCEKCPDADPFPNFNALRSHTRITHKTVLRVNCCTRSFRYRCDLAEHVRECHAEEGQKIETGQSFKCDKCERDFTDKREFRSHRISAHLNCEICGMDMRKRKLQPHEVWAHAQQHDLSDDPAKLAPYICDLCGKSFSDRRTFKRHLGRMHLPAGAEPTFICEVCGVSLRTKQSVYDHVKAKHAEGLKKVPCPVCGVMITNNERAMQNHIKNVHNPQPATCETCGFIARNTKSLHEHVKRNHREKKYACKECDKRFSSGDRLRDHVATHLGINLYFCTLCNAKYKSKSNFASHKRKSHPEEYAAEKAANQAKKFAPQ